MRYAPLFVSLLLASPVAAGEARKKQVAVLVLERTVTEFGVKPVKKGEKREKPAAPGKPKIVKLSTRRYTVKLAPGRLREHCADTGEVSIVRFDRELIWMLDTKEKTYREVTFREINERSAQVRARLGRRLPMIEDGPHKEKLRDILGLGAKPPELTVTRPGKRRKILGESCELVVVKIGEEEFFRAWIAERRAPLVDSKWLLLGNCLSEKAAKKLAAIKGLLLEATFSMPSGGRLEISTGRIAEGKSPPEEFGDPAALGYERRGTRKKPSAGKKPGKKS